MGTWSGPGKWVPHKKTRMILGMAFLWLPCLPYELLSYVNASNTGSACLLVGMPYFMFDAEWKSIRERKQCKQRASNINNQRENAKRISHTYKVGDLVRSV